MLIKNAEGDTWNVLSDRHRSRSLLPPARTSAPPMRSEINNPSCFRVLFADVVIQAVWPKVHRETRVFTHSAGDGVFHFCSSMMWSFSDSGALSGPISDFLITRCTMHIFQLLQREANSKTQSPAENHWAVTVRTAAKKIHTKWSIAL